MTNIWAHVCSNHHSCTDEATNIKRNLKSRPSTDTSHTNYSYAKFPQVSVNGLDVAPNISRFELTAGTCRGTCIEERATCCFIVGVSRLISSIIQTVSASLAHLSSAAAVRNSRTPATEPPNYYLKSFILVAAHLPTMREVLYATSK